MAKYMLLIRGGNDAWANFTPEEVQLATQRYTDWTNELRASGSLVDGDRLIDGGVVVRKEAGQTKVDGPYTETKEMVGGYYFIEASDEAAATEIAKGCPGLDYGATVEVRAFWVW